MIIEQMSESWIGSYNNDFNLTFFITREITTTLQHNFINKATSPRGSKYVSFYYEG